MTNTRLAPRANTTRISAVTGFSGGDDGIAVLMPSIVPKASTSVRERTGAGARPGALALVGPTSRAASVEYGRTQSPQ